MSGIEEGWETHIETLRERQKAAESLLLKELAANSRQAMHGLTVVRNARIFDSETGRLGSASDVYVLRGHVTAIRTAGSVSGPVDNEIDAAGRVMLPGLFDMHTHVGRWEGGLHLAAGITTVRDMGSANQMIQQMLAEMEDGALLPKFNWSSQHRGTSVPASTSLRSPWRTRSTPFLSVRAVRSSLFQPPAGAAGGPPVEPCIHGSTSLVPLQWHGARSLWPWAWRCWCPLMPRTAPRLQPAILVSQIKRIARSSNGRRNMDLFGRAKQLIQRFCGR